MSYLTVYVTQDQTFSKMQDNTAEEAVFGSCCDENKFVFEEGLEV